MIGIAKIRKKTFLLLDHQLFGKHFFALVEMQEINARGPVGNIKSDGVAGDFRSRYLLYQSATHIGDENFIGGVLQIALYQCVSRIWINRNAVSRVFGDGVWKSDVRVVLS